MLEAYIPFQRCRVRNLTRFIEKRTRIIQRETLIPSTSILFGRFDDKVATNIDDLEVNGLDEVTSEVVNVAWEPNAT